MFKNILATIGLLVVVKKSYDLYCEYSDMKQENEFWRAQQQRNTAEKASLVTFIHWKTAKL